MWPFKKKPGLIRVKYLDDNAINRKFTDAFQRSGSVLKKDIAELEKQSAMWKTKANRNHEQKTIKKNVMKRLKDKLDATDDPTEQKDLILQLDKEDKHFTQLVRETLDIKDSSRAVCNTIGLLESILSGTYTDPEILSDPPPSGWPGGWDDLFGEAGQTEDVSQEELNEHLNRFGIKSKPVKNVESELDDEADPADPDVSDGV